MKTEECPYCEGLDVVQSKYTDALRVLFNDRKFYMIVLNLSGKREDLETQAFNLINRHGYLKALKLSNQEEKR